MAAWMAAKEPAKADFIAGKLLQIDPDNVHALAHRVYAARAARRAGRQGGDRAHGRRRPNAALARWPSGRSPRRSTMPPSSAPRSR